MCTGSEAGSDLRCIEIVSLNSRLVSNKEEEEEFRVDMGTSSLILAEGLQFLTPRVEFATSL
jgi:hypothetical protein